MKNVAGYDFCKLLTGSLGTLAVITQLALKVKPLPETSATVVAACPDLATADILLDRLVEPPRHARRDRLSARRRLERADAIRSPQSEIRSDTPHLVIRVEGIGSRNRTGSPIRSSTSSGKAAG